MSSEPGESAPRPALYSDHRDLTPFRTPVIRTPVRGLAEGVTGVLAGRIRGTLPVEGGTPRLGKVGGRSPSKSAKAAHAAIFGSSDPDRLIALAHTYPGWAGLCYLMAGLQSYAQGGYLRASELLQRGLLIRNDDGGRAFVQGRTDYGGDSRSYDNLWVIQLTGDGRATEFTEWYMPRK